MNESTVVGLSIQDLLDIRHKLDVLGISTSNLLEFLDMDKVQLFAEKERKIAHLERKIADAKKALGGSE